MVKDTLNVNGESIIHYYLGEYLPKNRFEQDKFSEDVLSFKSAGIFAIRRFTEMMLELIYKEDLKFDIIIPIPKSSEDSFSIGSKNLVNNLSKHFNVENGTGILRRIESLNSAHLSSGSDRPTEEQQYQSISCEERLSGRNVLLFDDVLTTSNTASGCIRNILEKGCSEITLITLAKTAQW